MYGSASVAEEVCHLNRWDQCSLPLNALETALELRQLDTVSFFLRNRGEDYLVRVWAESRVCVCVVFADSLSQQSEEGHYRKPRPPPPLPPDQLDAAVDLLTNSIK